jgi:DNA-directed RNA polymerase specialized sigma24 family protein
MSKTPGENKVVEEIIKGNEKVLTTVYKNVYKHMERYSLSMNSSVLNAKEAVQDAFEIFYRQILEGNLTLTCSVETYIVSIAKRLFLKHEINWNYQFQDQPNEMEEQISEDEDENVLIEKTIEEKKDELYRSTFKLLPLECQQVLSLTIEGYSSAEITKLMNYSTTEYTNNKRLKCKKYLIEKIKENPDYENLRNANTENYELPVRPDEPAGKNDI